MDNMLVYRIVESYLLNRKFINLTSHMFYHIESCNEECDINIQKQEKLYKLISDIHFIKGIPLSLHKLSYYWIEYRWKLLVKQCGFKNVVNTLKYLDYKITNNNLVEDNMQYHINSVFYKTHIINIIKPFYCKIIDKQNTKVGIKIYGIKPSLKTIDGKLYGLYVEYMNETKSCIIFGLIDEDSLRKYRKYIDKTTILTELAEKCNMTFSEIQPYLNCFSLRDYLIYETRQIINKIKQKIEKIVYYKTAENNVLYDEFTFLPYEYKIELLTVLLELNMKDKVYFITECFHFQPKHFDLSLRIRINYIPKIDVSHSVKQDKSHITLEDTINNLNTSDKNKSKAFDKLKVVNMSNDGAPKAQKYVDGFLKIPFNITRTEDGLYNPEGDIIKEFKSKHPDIKIDNIYLTLKKLLKNDNKDIVELSTNKLVLMNETRKNQKKYLIDVEKILNDSVHGHELVKIQFKRLLAQWITGGQSGIIIGIEGPPGVGKTSLIKEGLAKCLLNKDGEARPVGFIPLGGSSSVSTLVGHGYTYQGSTWGRIVDILMECGCMNPIFLFDELDKVSKTESGREVSSILTHLTDSSQNKEFHDKYFEGVSLDLSTALMIFTFNNRCDIDPILLDRMNIIETKALTLDDKKIITKKHLIPQISKRINVNPGDIKLSNNIIESIICDYTREAGIRQFKKILESLCQELNLRRLLKPTSKMIINNKLVDDVLYHSDKILKETISTFKYLVGQINGMYANVLGMGGILPIQVSKNINENKMELTGMQGDVMKESMICAKTNAYGLLNKFMPDINIENKNSDKIVNGLHIHVPSAATPKDGPSAGGAITLAIYSFLSKKTIRTDIAMTGEIDLRGNIKAFGGLYAKLYGAKKANIKIAIIPYENKEQLERIRNENKSPEDKSFKVIMINHIEETLEHVFI